MCQDEQAMRAWIGELQSMLSSVAEDLNPDVGLEPVQGKDDVVYHLPRITIFVHQLPQYYTLDPLFIASGDYTRLYRLSSSWNGLLAKESFLRHGEKDFAVNDFHHLWEMLMTDARRGLTIQRYKGLGEMNADQLWETTMDPENRRMLKITIEDAIKADHLFSCLMGDDVEPRRIFIEENALNTDIDA